jgi:hypothetical protein
VKQLVSLVLVFVGLFSPINIVKANIPSRKPLLKTEEVLYVQANRLYGGSRAFKESDGYEEVVINKVVKWINKSSPSEEVAESGLDTTPLVASMKIKMKNGEVVVIEPAYNCISKGQTKTCTLADGEVIYSWNNNKIRLRSLELYDWLLVGWKYESVGAPKDELLEETLYTRYFNYLDQSYSDFISCPKIDKIERINGDGRRHIIHASALSFSTHHNGPDDRIHITITDTPEHGVKINKVKVEKSISGQESRIQCRREG